jgi:GNAT superfamily N-acetyltransferase
MATPIQLRQPRAGDEPEIAKLCGQMGYPSTADEVKERLLAISDLDDHMVLVATNDQDKSIGWVHVHLSYRLLVETFAELGGLVVSVEHRGLGIGERLMLEAEDWAKARGAKVMRVRSNVVRQRAHGFYQQSGYEQVKTSYVFKKVLT